MKQNVGILDTTVRSLCACALIAVALEGFFGATVSLLLIGIGAILWTTSIFGICPLYNLLGIDTYPDFRDDSYHAH